MKIHFSAFRLRRPAPWDLPRTADDVDLDRVIWDPAYRRAAKALLKTAPGKPATKGEKG